MSLLRRGGGRNGDGAHQQRHRAHQQPRHRGVHRHQGHRALDGKTYTATVVGSDTTDDVAVLKLSGASGLATIRIDDDAETVGQAVTAVGNAEGQDSLTAAAGTITALKASVTTASEGAVAGETLRNMLRPRPDVVSGDSGGALIDSQAEVVGMDTAASSGTTPTSPTRSHRAGTDDRDEHPEGRDQQHGDARISGVPGSRGVQ
ncbi:S1C family serine protease [Acidipropionibacterium acidipropionici]|uniref:S1C family serine protease n=1 Tax=Acidipropionibacterium acidipropionici TaxID=1748 RepID=UPI0013140015|nr:trypsin-like peptidase domain-containing protein [Acidipropionibacterium acidipropionici]